MGGVESAPGGEDKSREEKRDERKEARDERKEKRLDKRLQRVDGKIKEGVEGKGSRERDERLDARYEKLEAKKKELEEKGAAERKEETKKLEVETDENLAKATADDGSGDGSDGNKIEIADGEKMGAKEHYNRLLKGLATMILDEMNNEKGIARDVKIRGMRTLLKVGSIGGVEWVKEFNEKEIAKLGIKKSEENDKNGDVITKLKWLDLDLEKVPSYWPKKILKRVYGEVWETEMPEGVSYDTTLAEFEKKIPKSDDGEKSKTLLAAMKTAGANESTKVFTFLESKHIAIEEALEQPVEQVGDAVVGEEAGAEDAAAVK